MKNRMENPRPQTAIAAAILAVAIIVGTLVIAEALYKARALGNTVAVTGSAERIIQSDTIKWTGSFSRNVDPTGLKGGSEQMNADLKLVQDYLKAKGVQDSEIKLQPVTVTAVCASQNNVMYDKNGNQLCSGNNLSGYSLQQSFTVESDNVDQVGKIAQAATNDLIAQGVTFTSNPPEYYYNKLADLKMDMITQATKNAKDRADRIIQTTGGKIGGVQSAGTGVFQVTQVNSTEVSDYGTYDTTTPEKKVTAIVRVSFLLK